MAAAALVTHDGHVELLLPDLDMHELLQGPVHQLSVLQGVCTLYYTTAGAGYAFAEVNAFATALAGQLVKGDVCLVHREQQALFDCLRQHQSKHRLQLAGTSLAAASDVSTHTTAAAADWSSSSSSAGAPHVPKRNSSAAANILAANSTRQRILRMSAGCASALVEPAAAVHAASTTPPQHQQPVPAAALAAWCGGSSLPPPLGRGVAGSSGRMPAGANDTSSSSSSSRSSFDRRSSSSQTGSGGTSGQPPHHQGSACSHGAARVHAHCQQQPAGPCSQGNAPHSSSSITPAHEVDSSTACSQADAGAALAPCPLLPAWDDLPVEVIALIARFCGDTVGAVAPLCMACSSWRRAVLEDDQLLTSLAFRLTGRSSSSWQQQQAAAHRLPAALERACKLGNVSALVVVARLLDAVGASDDAMRCWRRAAKRGHLEGQLLFGLALYRGSAGVGQDAEDAHLWLSKALKQVPVAKQPGGDAAGAGSSGSSTTSTGSSTTSTAAVLPAPATCSSGPAAVAERQAAALHARVLCQAGLVLGYLCFDGEGTRIDKLEAVKYLKLAAGAGCKEAQQVLGWIFNTGQFGN